MGTAGTVESIDTKSSRMQDVLTRGYTVGQRDLRSKIVTCHCNQDNKTFIGKCFNCGKIAHMKQVYDSRDKRGIRSYLL